MGKKRERSRSRKEDGKEKMITKKPKEGRKTKRGTGEKREIWRWQKSREKENEERSKTIKYLKIILY